ncbi:glycosyltransferase family protein [Bdellovibrio bacteriovorus]|uniref:Glycosyl transferase n=1 Tax=Bdellovibrio bacteriovorus str. Tiberius TaxID=1069642 RepID=K7ZGD8_BDEBC|nr:glycosyltransferase [Bdellovibrio bacteriovorus]AFY02372.1 glycosyl transferase [Bdellovibrio bacteriovorus str. Tiberius]
MTKPRLLFYCQHLLGIGHLTRSLAICEALNEDFEVHFLQGGPDVGKTLKHPSFHHHFLTPLLMRESDCSLYDPAGVKTAEEIFQERQQSINTLLGDLPFAAVITELFPFGRNKFKGEVMDLIQKARTVNSMVHVSCSIRDILVEKKDSVEREMKMVRLVEENYDAVFVHSDPQILRFEETFSQATRLQEKLCYTGFVTESPKAKHSLGRRNEILISMGGGVVGDELVLAALEIMPSLPEYLFRVAPGPYASEALKKTLAEKAANNPQLRIEPFLNNFEEELSQVALSISLAGYNTMMNILNTRTPALVYPYMANIEQNLRATRMADQGLLSVIYEKDLTPADLLKKVKNQLQHQWPSLEVGLKGAKQTSKLLSNILQERTNS